MGGGASEELWAYVGQHLVYNTALYRCPVQISPSFQEDTVNAFPAQALHQGVHIRAPVLPWYVKYPAACLFEPLL